MPSISTSLIEILDPPGNPWLRQFVPGKTEKSKGVRIVRHAGSDEDTFDRNERLRAAKRKLHDFIDGLE
jgi:hypothetical protein